MKHRTLPLAALGILRQHGRKAAACLALPFLLSACISMAPKERVPKVVTNLPSDYSKHAATGTYQPTEWWHDFEDPILNQILSDALRDNLDIAEAAARARKASAQKRIAFSTLLPQIDANAGRSYSNSSLSGSALGSFGGGTGRLRTETYSAGLGASYELDLFGRSNSELKSRRADVIAADADTRSVKLAMAAQTISTYFEIVDARRQIELAQYGSGVLTERLAITEDRYRRGLVSSFELYQIRQRLRDVQAAVPLRESALDSAEGRLAVLLAIYPQQLRERLSAPLTPRLSFKPVSTGLPADLLLQRPDVHAAWQRLESARHTIGARRAQRFPSLRLNGSIGGQGGTADDALRFGTNWATSLAANIVAPIFDGGRITAQIAAARAGYDERAARYARAVLNAFREVSSATKDYAEKHERYRLIHAQHRDAKASLDLQAKRFESGVDSYLAYLDAQISLQQVLSNLSAADRDAAIARLNVHRALGGNWAETADENRINMIISDTISETREDAQ